MTLEQACPSEYQRAQCAFKDSMTHWNSAIRITYRISLRSSSMPEPRDPLLKVLIIKLVSQTTLKWFGFDFPLASAHQPESRWSEDVPPKQQRIVNKGWKFSPIKGPVLR